MKLAVFLLPQAEADIDDHFAYIAIDSVEAALNFESAVFESLNQLCMNPLVGSERIFAHPRLSGLRMWIVKGFENYLIFYRPLETHIELIRVLHTAQDRDSILDADLGS